MSSNPKSSFLSRIYTGRISRLNYLKGSLFSILPFVLLFLAYWFSAIAKVISAPQTVGQGNSAIDNGATLGGLFPTLITLFGLVAFAFYAVVAPSLVVRRHHDFNQSWIYPVVIIAIISILTLMNGMLASVISTIYCIFLMFYKGTSDLNQYGSPDVSRKTLQIVGLKI